MLEFDGKIVSLDILCEGFCCDLGACRGECCVDGNSGAPLEENEADLLEKHYADYRPFMKPAGIESVGRQGFAVTDEDGDLTTPLINDAECAYSFEEGGVTLCAVERAAIEGFPKPVSCHLYPIRVTRFGDGSLGLNYHRWSVCSAARKSKTPVYKSLREPIIRAFGEEFYDGLEAAAKEIRG